MRLAYRTSRYELGLGPTTWTWGVYPFHVANTEYVVDAWLKSTRSQPAAPQVITEYPVAGVADTSVTMVRRDRQHHDAAGGLVPRQ